MRPVYRYLCACGVLCVACGLAPARVAVAQSSGLWAFASLPQAAWLALPCLAALAWFSSRAPEVGPPVRAPQLGWARGTLLVVSATLLFAVWRDTSRAGDYHRVLADMTAGVWLLKAEPLGPASFQLLLRAAVWFGLQPLQGIQWLLGLLSAGGLLWLWRVCAQDALAGESAGGVWLRFAVAASCGSSALYFGHVETYTLPLLAMLGYCLAAQRVLSTGNGFGWACAAFTLACALHMQMLCVGPSLMVCGVAAARVHGLRRLWQWPASSGLLLLALQWLCLQHPPPYAQFYGGGDGHMLVRASQLWTPGYWLDGLNRLLLFAPGALAAVVLWRPRWRPFTALRGAGRPAAFWPALAGGWALFILLWNADLGAWRDWDLFAPCGVVFTLAGLHWLSRRMPLADFQWACAAWALVNVSRTLPFVLDNHLRLP